MTAKCRNRCNANFGTVAHVTQEWEVDKHGNFVNMIGNGEVTHGPDAGNIWSCLKCGAEAEVTELTENSERIINTLPVELFREAADVLADLEIRGYTHKTVADAVVIGMNNINLEGKTTEEIADEIEDIYMPMKVFNVTIRWKDDGEICEGYLIAEAESPEELMWGFTDEDIFFFGMTRDQIYDAYNNKELCEGEWYIDEVHGVQMPVLNDKNIGI